MDKNKCSSCGEAPHKCSCKNKDFTKAVIEIDNPEQITLMRRVVIPMSMGDDTAVPPAIGKYHNVLLYYEANQKSYLYSSDGIPTLLANGVTDYEQAVNLPQINGVTLLGDKSSADLGLQPTLSVSPDTGIKLDNSELSGLPATDTTIGMVKPGDGLGVDSEGTLSVNGVAFVFDTVSDMQSSTGLSNGDYAKTLGYYAANDGGGCEYQIIENEPNNRYYIKLDSGLFATILNGAEVTVDKLGAKKNSSTLGELYNDLATAQKFFPDANDLTEYVDYVAISTACTYYPNHVKLNNGKYYINKPILLQNNETKVSGNGYVNTVVQMNISPDTLTYIFDLNEKLRCEFRNFTVMSAYAVPEDHEGTDAYLVAGFKVQNTQNNYFENIRGYNLFHTWYFNNTWVDTLYRCRSNKVYKGVSSSGSDLNNIIFRNCVFQQSHIGVHLTGGRSHLIDGCDIEDNDIGIYRELKGDIEITNTYFEDYIQFAYNTTPIDNILISGCSFWIGKTYTRLPSIRYDGALSTKMTIINCNFELARDAVTQTTPTIAPYTDQNISDNVKPTVINANVVSQGSATTQIINNYFDGIIINKNVVYDTLTTKLNYVNLDDTSSLTLDLHKGAYRFGGTGGGSSTIAIPDITSFYYDTQEWSIYVAGNINNTNTTSFTITGGADTTISGQTTFTLGDLSGKVVKIRWLGVISSKNFWQVYVV